MAELHHPIAGNLFGTAFVSLLLLPLVLAPLNLWLARLLWCSGAVAMMVFAWWVVTRWMSDRQQVEHATPAWVIPVVGVLDVPLAVPVLGFSPEHAPLVHQLMVMDVAVGLFFAIPLFTLIFSRLLFQEPMPDALLPTLLILVAPFAVGYSAYTLTAGGSDLFAEALYLLSLFMLAVLLPRLRKLGGTCPFRFSWWSVSFPLAATTIAGLRYAATERSLLSEGIAALLLALATVVITSLLLRTLVGLFRGELQTMSG
jgi:tellurite resistance protein